MCYRVSQCPSGDPVGPIRDSWTGHFAGMSPIFRELW